MPKKNATHSLVNNDEGHSLPNEPDHGLPNDHFMHHDLVGNDISTKQMLIVLMQQQIAFMETLQNLPGLKNVPTDEIATSSTIYTDSGPARFPKVTIMLLHNMT
jgi:hypothetical protein